MFCIKLETKKLKIKIIIQEDLNKNNNNKES
jgi:hypothetical protein